MSDSDSWDSGSGSERGHGMKYKKKEKKDKDKKEKKDKDKKDKKDKDKKEKKDKDKHEGTSGHHEFSHGATFGAATGGSAATGYLSTPSAHTPAAAFPSAGPGFGHPAPPPYTSAPGFPQHGDNKQAQFSGAPPPPPPPATSNNAPPSGFRVPLHTDSTFPPPDQTGPPVAFDLDGKSPVFIGSALFETSVHPCKIGPHLRPAASVPYGGTEHGHHGRYDLLPFVPERMEWVYTSYGRIPPGRRPIEGGYEENGSKLYHALANVNGVSVPGKAGEHLGAANVAYGGQELAYQEYQILCWK